MLWTALALDCLVMGSLGTIASAVLALKLIYEASFNRSEYTGMRMDEAFVIVIVLAVAYGFSIMAVWGGTTLDVFGIFLPAIQPSGTLGWL